MKKILLAAGFLLLPSIVMAGTPSGRVQVVTATGSTTLTVSKAVVEMTCTNASGCAVTMATGAPTVVRTVTIICLNDGVSGKSCTFANQATLVALPGGSVSLSDEDTLQLVYSESRDTWLKVAGSDNTSAAPTPTPTLTPTPVPTATPTP